MSSLRQKVDNILKRELEWQKQKNLKKEAKFCKWIDCPLETCSIEKMWEHVFNYHVFWQPFLDENGNRLVSHKSEEKEEECQPPLSRKSRDRGNKDHVCLWNQCLLFKKLMKRSELTNHIKNSHLKTLKMTQVLRPRSHEYTQEVLKFMKEEVVNRLKTKAGMATNEPVYKTKVRMTDGSLRDLKPDEVLADGETIVSVFDARLYQADQ